MTLIRVAPDMPVQRVLCVGSFEVDADMSEGHVRERVYPAARAKWLLVMAAQGYELHGGNVYLFPKCYAVTVAPDSGEAGTGAYEHNPLLRARVNRKMAAWFLKRAVQTEVSVN